MFQTLTFFHSIVRWLVLISLLWSIFRAYRGMASNLVFSKRDNSIRHWTATIGHIQLLIGILLFTQSPHVQYFWKYTSVAVHNPESLFFGLIHIVLMLAAIVVLTVGSALSKRRLSDRGKFKTMLIWFAIALLLILIAIPWPFSPVAQRPYFRPF